MSKLSVAPSLVFPDLRSRPLVQLPRVHSKFDESFLQSLLASHPELLPAKAIRDDVGELLCIGREVRVDSGFIDNLYLSTAGYPVIVETKLWRNPEARREVFSQTLDYIKDLTRTDFEWFDSQWRAYRTNTAHQSLGLVEAVSDIAEKEEIEDERDFIDRVNRALTRGDILAMIVGDGIETRLKELVDHLCEDSAHLRYALALCEMSFYQLPESNGLIAVPRIVSNVEPVQRAYVRVEFAKGLETKLAVTPVEVTNDPEPKPARINLTEEDFLHSVETVAGVELCQKMAHEYNDLLESFGLEAAFKKASVMIKIPDPEGEHLAASVIAFEAKGNVFNTDFLPGRLKKWGTIPDEAVDKICSDYWSALNKVDSRFSLDGISHLSPKRFIPLADLLPKWAAVKAAVGDVVTKVRSQAV